MTSHEFARQLLEGEDLPLVVYFSHSECSVEVHGTPCKLMREKNTEDTYYLEEVEKFGLDVETLEPVLEISL